VTDFDIIVIGGGPAGAATAIQAARGGARVAIFEKASEGRDKVCGDGLTPRAIAALQDLEKDYHDKNITFLSISVDTDKDSWLKMLSDKNLGGVQLWADGWSDITKSYAIFGIPRFLLFDQGGKIISTDAPRPTSPEIRQMIDSNL